MKIKYLFLLVSFASIVHISSQESDKCFLTRADKKKPMRDFRVTCLENSKDLLKESSKMMQQAGHLQEIVIDMLEEACDTFSKEELDKYNKAIKRAYDALETCQAAIKKCENEIHSIINKKN